MKRNLLSVFLLLLFLWCHAFRMEAGTSPSTVKRPVTEEEATRDLIALAKSEPKAFAKAQTLIEELKDHPRTGTGHPEPLSGDRVGQWSRRITKKHRLVYEIHDTEVIVLVLTAYGHYEDK